MAPQRAHIDVFMHARNAWRKSATLCVPGGVRPVHMHPSNMHLRGGGKQSARSDRARPPDLGTTEQAKRKSILGTAPHCCGLPCLSAAARQTSSGPARDPDRSVLESGAINDKHGGGLCNLDGRCFCTRRPDVGSHSANRMVSRMRRMLEAYVQGNKFVQG